MTEMSSTLQSLRAAVAELQRSLESARDGEISWVAARVRDSVSRPLQVIAEREEMHGDDPVGWGERLWELAQRATELVVGDPDTPGLLEAAAALQDLAVSTADDPSGSARLDELAGLAAGMNPSIRVARNGPYLVTNPRSLTNRLGEPLGIRPSMALCRCGQSSIKPLCDGTHAAVGFTGEKDPSRVPDRLDVYPGVRVTVVDNRGTCSHAGYCTDRLNSVFHAGGDPFVTPSGARMDDIVRAVRTCPSGALGLQVDDELEHDEIDTQRPASIEVSKDGPYRVTGGVPLVDDTGAPVDRNAGASLEHYALCRCGHSQNKPFCTGMHWYVNFRDPVPDEGREPTLFEWVGGLPVLTNMTRVFYEKYVPDDPLLSPLFAKIGPDLPERVAAWLGEVLGGPTSYSDHYGGYDQMISQHLGRDITEAQRSRWLQLLTRAADDVRVPADPEFRAAFVSYLEWESRRATERSTAGVEPPRHLPAPRWRWIGDAAPGAPVFPVGVDGDEPDAPVVLAEPADTVSFARHIKSLFRRKDQQSMSYAFDLWSHEDVTKHAQAILQQVRDGTMPCDGAWPQAYVDAFQRWIATGTAP
jgi:CDGSH-type Zn-finger protein/truncated hemoglobin YjbI